MYHDLLYELGFTEKAGNFEASLSSKIEVFMMLTWLLDQQQWSRWLGQRPGHFEHAGWVWY